MKAGIDSRKISARLLVCSLMILPFICWVVEAGGTEHWASSVEKTKVMPADVLLEVQALNRELELLRRYMGAPKANLLDIRVYNAAPYDVYYQARTLFQKANRLSFEIVRQQERAPAVPREVPVPADVLDLVKGARRAVQKVTTDLDIPKTDADSVREETRTPTDVLKAIQATNRQMNQLLERRFAPSDVYEQVTLAIGYAARQLSRYPEATRIPDKPPFEKEKNPSDVYFRLLDCLESISRIYKTADLEMVEIDSSHVDNSNITPSDVFDVASMVVARLDYLHRSFGLDKMPRETFYPGRKYPADVYQQAGILQAQLDQLKGLIRSKRVPSKQGGEKPQ